MSLLLVHFRRPGLWPPIDRIVLGMSLDAARTLLNDTKVADIDGSSQGLFDQFTRVRSRPIQPERNVLRSQLPSSVRHSVSGRPVAGVIPTGHVSVHAPLGHVD